MGHKRVCEAMEHVIGVEPSLYQDGDALPTEFIDDRQNLYGMAVMRALCHEVIGSDIVTMRWPEPDTRPIVEPQTSAFGLLLRNLQPLLAPDTFHSLMIDPPTLPSEQSCDTARAIPPIPFNKLDNFLSESLLGSCPLGNEPLGRPGLTQYPACSPL